MGDKFSSLEWLPDLVDRPKRPVQQRSRNLEVLSYLRRGLTVVLDGLFPHSCPVCNELVQSDGGLCVSCWQTLELISAPIVSGLAFLCIMIWDQMRGVRQLLFTRLIMTVRVLLSFITGLRVSW